MSDEEFIYNEETTEESTYADELLDSLRKNRDSLLVMIDELEQFKKHVSKLLPDTIDKRFVRLFEEKIKTITSLFELILKIRMEYSKQIKDELELRRKLNLSDNEQDIEELLDVRELDKKIESIQDKKLKVIEKIGNE